MILLFVVANGFIASYFLEITPSWNRYALAILLALSFFFRLGLFNELNKDEEYNINKPTRSLVRRLISVQEMRTTAFALIAFEIILSGYIGFYALVPMAIAIGYSVLMYNEFFIGPWLRNQLVLRTFIHSLASTFLGYALAVVITGKAIRHFPWLFFVMGVINWNLFNFFEFTKKTLAPEEEEPHVDSYTSLYGLWRALKLSLAQAFLACIIGEMIIGQLMIGFFWGLLVLCIAGAIFVTKGSPIAAKTFRKLSRVFILYYFIILIIRLM